MLALKQPIDSNRTDTASVAAPLPGRPVPAARIGDPVNRLTLELYESMEPLETEWRWLERDSLNSLHHSWDWCRAWARSQKRPLTILRGERGGRTLFLLPLDIRTRRGVRIAGFAGDAFSNLNTGLMAAAFRHGEAIADPAALSQTLQRLLTGRADLVALRNMPCFWRGAVNPLASLGAFDNHNRSFQLPLFSDMETTIQPLNAKRRRKKFRSQQRRLETLGGYEHVIAETAEEKADLLDLFFRQKARRFADQGLPDVFGAPETRAFFHALAQAGDDARHMPLRLHALRLKGAHEGHIGAISGLSLNGDHVLCQFGSIDDSQAADVSPGEFLFWLMIEQYGREGYALFDFGIGDQPYKRSWCSAEVAMHDLLLPVTTVGRLACAAAQGLVHAKAFIKRHRRLYAAIQRLRAGRASGGETQTGDQAA